MGLVGVQWQANVEGVGLVISVVSWNCGEVKGG